MSELATYLRAARAEKGHSLRQAAAVSGVSPSTLSRVERNVQGVDTESLRKIAVYCGANLVDLVMGNHPPVSDEEVNDFLEGHGHNLERLRQEMNALIDELRDTARAILREKARK